MTTKLEIIEYCKLDIDRELFAKIRQSKDYALMSDRSILFIAICHLANEVEARVTK